MEYASGLVMASEAVKEPSQSLRGDLAFKVAVPDCGKVIDQSWVDMMLSPS